MADIPASNWDETDASNTTAAPDGMPEGMSPSGVNNWGRAVAGAVKRWFNWTIPKTTAGTTTAYTLAYGVAPGALVDGMTHLVQFNAANGAAPTLNINALGAKPLHYYTGSTWAAVPTGAIGANMVVNVTYNSAAGTYRIAAPAAPIFGFSLGTNGYISIFPVVIQWGSLTVSVGSPQTITFPVAFSVAPYSVQVTANSNSGPLVGGSHSATSAGTTSFVLTNGGSNNIPFYWLAIGAA